jgi:hypothetical protein
VLVTAEWYSICARLLFILIHFGPVCGFESDHSLDRFTGLFVS